MTDNSDHNAGEDQTQGATDAGDAPVADHNAAADPAGTADPGAQVPAPNAAVETTPSASAAAPASEPRLAAVKSAPRAARAVTGVVTSNKADKTITVRVERRVKHPVYGKYIRRSTHLAAHDENNQCREGDVVTITETRPISKSKSWTLRAVVERASE